MSKRKVSPRVVKKWLRFGAELAAEIKRMESKKAGGKEGE